MVRLLHVADRMAGQPRRPGGRPSQTEQHPDRGRLPCPVRPQEPEHLTGVHRQVKIADRPPVPVPLAQPLDLDCHLGVVARPASTATTLRKTSSHMIRNVAGRAIDRRHGVPPASAEYDADQASRHTSHHTTPRRVPQRGDFADSRHCGHPPRPVDRRRRHQKETDPSGQPDCFRPAQRAAARCGKPCQSLQGGRVAAGSRRQSSFDVGSAVMARWLQQAT